MKRVRIFLALSSSLLMGCATPIVAYTPISTNMTAPSIISTTNPPFTPPSVVLEILSEKSIEPAVNVDFNRQLVASIPNCKWKVVGGSLPAGSMKLGSAGAFSGVANQFKETGSFIVEVTSGGQVISRGFTFKVVDVVWANPPVVNVSNFHPGARAEYFIKVHNDDSIMQERKLVTTDKTDVPDAQGLITAPIPLNQRIHDGDSVNVISITTDNPSEKLRAVSYDSEKGTLIVKGFLPLTSRIMTITYAADSMFIANFESSLAKIQQSYVDDNSVYRLLDGNKVYKNDIDFIPAYFKQVFLALGFTAGNDAIERWNSDLSKMVSISETSFMLAPHTTKEVLVAIEMPDNYKLDIKEFNFRIRTGRGIATQGNVTLVAINAVTWSVKMR